MRKLQRLSKHQLKTSKPNLMKKSLLSLLLLPFSLLGTAQQYNYQSQVELPKKDGYYEILISPAITGRATRDLADLRIYSEHQREIPYILRSEQHDRRLTGFKNYKIYDRDYHRGWDYESRCFIRNDRGSAINHLVLKIRNFEDAKRVRLSGSDDGQRWFMIKDGYRIFEANGGSLPYQYKVLRFPLSSYKYYKIEVDDSWHRDPINIEEVGFFDEESILGNYQRIPTPVLTQVVDRDAKQSKTTIQFEQTQWVDKLRIHITSEENFHRRAELYAKRYEQDSTFYLEKVKSFWLSSTQLNELQFNKLYAQELILVVHDKDNYPVKIDGANAFQLKRYAVCELQKGKHYFLQYGDRKAKKPEYDLIYFAADIPEDLKTLKSFNQQRLNVLRSDADQLPVITDGPYLQDEPQPVNEVQPTPTDSSVVVEEVKPFFQQPYFLWGIAGVVIVLLGYMSLRMMTEVREKENGAGKKES